MIKHDGLEFVFDQILEATRLHLSDLKPSEWYEKNMVMPRGSAFPGPFSFDLTPYWREPLDCADRNHPAKEISIMKGAQLGGTVAVLNPIVGYTITQNPGNIMFLTGHSDLTKAAFLKIDTMIDNCGIRNLIRPNVMRGKNSRSGDTDVLKEFAGGDLKAGSVTNHNLLRQHDVMVMIVDDFDASKMKSKEAGSTRELVQKRTSAFAHKKKIYYVSSPQIEDLSNIESVFKLGDQRYYNVHCPNCKDAIVLKWEIQIDDRNKAGITWKLDNHGHLDRKSVGYICQTCGHFFNETHKYVMNLEGFWKPTVIPIEENHFSYQISSLYSPPGMDDWAHYVQQYINAHPLEGKVDQAKLQTFFNVVLGMTFKQTGKAPEATAIQKNIREYAVGIVPETQSINDGNGKIIMLTCACDLNGKEDDARLDFEIVGWSVSGSSYSIIHGSIGTFVPNESKVPEEKKVKRDKWSYKHKVPNSVWPELEKLLGSVFKSDNERTFRIMVTALDTGKYTDNAYKFLDATKQKVIGVKGNKANEFRKENVDIPIFKQSAERTKLFILDVNHIKDQVAAGMDLMWMGGQQPAGFMNYPKPSGGLYKYDNFFKHYESEHRITETKEGFITAARWEKKTSSSQNHYWDVFIYNYAIKEVWASLVLAMSPLKKGSWHDFVQLYLGKYN